MEDDSIITRVERLGAAVRSARKAQGLSQARLAQMIGQSNGQAYITRIEAGNPVSITQIIKIADALGLKVSDLIDF